MTTLYTKRGLLLVALVAVAVPLQAQTARVQFVHASPDWRLNTIDVYVDGLLFTDSLQYARATPYLEITTGAEGHQAEITVVQMGDSIEESQVVGTVNLTPDQHWYAVLHGMTDTTGWPAVEGRDIGAKIAFGLGGTTPVAGFETGFTTRQFHAVTDLETLDWRLGSGTVVYHDRSYGTFSSPISSTSAGTFTGYGTPVDSPWPRLFTFDDVQFSSMEGERFLEVLIGVYGTDLIRRQAQNLWVHPSGEVELRPMENRPAEVQFLAASPDPELEFVDIWVDGFKVRTDMSTASCSEYLLMTGGIPVEVAVTPAGSTSPREAVWADTLTFGSRMDYQAVLAGFVDPEDVDNPYGYDLSAQLFMDDEGKANWTTSERGWRMFHGSPDWGDLDFYVGDNLDYQVIDDLAYGTFSDWLSNNGTSVVGTLTPGSSKERLYSGWGPPGDMGHSVLTVVAGVDQVHQLMDFQDDGTTAVTSTDDETDASLPTQWRLRGNYPNPFNPTTVIEVEVPIAGVASVEIFDALGRLVDVVHDGMLSPGVHQLSWTPSDVVSGIYLYRLAAPGVTMTRAMVLHK